MTSFSGSSESELGAGGNVKLLSSKLNFKKVHSRVSSFDINHIPRGGDKNYILSLTNIKFHVSSLDNIQHGGDVRIFDEKLKFRELSTPKKINHSSITSKVDSSVIADNSPMSSLALDDVSEDDNDSPPSHEEYQTFI
ncbi:1800_t:CDS:2 [Funneliformis caledonium]|uniref:1800_t:CDS:1 n=1 Tax=Funneliformis caledonium TaxID=1117310 RepID=A0A9N9C0F2_9GLOM|nr:1800_t:CDS:2 [Funneliformis caledonium]